MAHDYVKRAKSTPKKSPSKTRGKKKPVKATTPGWLMMMYGMAGGFIVAVLAYFVVISPDETNTTTMIENNHQLSQPDAKGTVTTQTEKKQPETTKAVVEEDETDVAQASSFEFYTILPESEVIVPNPDNNVSPSVTEPENAGITYMLQAGAFRSGADADRLRARLLLMGLEAKIQTVSVSQGETWHRVQVGPFKTTQATTKAQTMLTNANIETLLLKLKP